MTVVILIGTLVSCVACLASDGHRCRCEGCLEICCYGKVTTKVSTNKTQTP